MNFCQSRTLLRTRVSSHFPCIPSRGECLMP
uniref:Uncharacterized protein n=1 Tax=Arundo donax TaxID=35708 RepID=A0A0A9EGJ5_ARUDO